MAERNYYQETIDRIEPDIAMIDVGAGWASIAISLRRIADVLQAKHGQGTSMLTAVVRKADEDYAVYAAARFGSSINRISGVNEVFAFRGHLWRYRLTSFDDYGQYDVLERPLFSAAEAHGLTEVPS